jgi:uncharacterized protein (TIGR00661 family)
MKILSVITGIGYGHATRQEAILKELKKQGAEIIVASYGTAFNFFEHYYHTLEIDGPQVSEKKFEFKLLKTLFMNLKLPYYYLKNYFKLRRLVKAFNPDIIISDFEPLPLFMSKDIPHFLFFNFDPELYKEYVTQGYKRYFSQRKYINWVYKRAKKISAPIIIPTFEKSASNEVTYVNPIVRPLPERSQKALLEKLNLSKPPILIMFGGSYFSTSLLYKIQEILPQINEKFIIFTYKLSGESYKNVTFLPFKENFLEYLKASKAIITQAGHSTLSESVILKKPSLIFPIPNYLEHAVNSYWAKKKKIAVIKNPKHLTEEAVLKIIQNFVNSLPDMEKSLSNLNIEPNGAEQAANLIIEKYKSLKPESDTEHKSPAP